MEQTTTATYDNLAIKLSAKELWTLLKVSSLLATIHCTFKNNQAGIFARMWWRRFLQ